MQAFNEIRQYDELLNALEASDLSASIKEGLALSITWSLWPGNILKLFHWLKRYLAALNKFSELVAEKDKDLTVIRIRAGLLKARNWAIVLLGSTLVLVASVVELLTR